MMLCSRNIEAFQNETLYFPLKTLNILLYRLILLGVQTDELFDLEVQKNHAQRTQKKSELSHGLYFTAPLLLIPETTQSKS